MKKQFIFILCVILLMGVTGCKKDSASTGSSVSSVITSISKGSETSTSTTVEEPEPEPEIPEYEVMFEVITLGKYEQDNNTSNGAEPIEWIVLEKKDGKALVISRYILDQVPFVKGFGDADWEHSTIRKWLNKEFLGSFTDGETARIVTSFVPAEEQKTITDEAGNVIPLTVSGTDDKVFLLSDFELKQYLVDDPDTWGDEAYAYATAYAEAQGVWVLTRERYKELRYTEETVSSKMIGSGWWWLRTSGSVTTKAKDVDTQGNIRENGHDNGESHDGIRPAMWITLE